MVDKKPNFIQRLLTKLFLKKEIRYNSEIEATKAKLNGRNRDKRLSLNLDLTNNSGSSTELSNQQIKDRSKQRYSLQTPLQTETTKASSTKKSRRKSKLLSCTSFADDSDDDVMDISNNELILAKFNSNENNYSGYNVNKSVGTNTPKSTPTLVLSSSKSSSCNSNSLSQSTLNSYVGENSNNKNTIKYGEAEDLDKLEVNQALQKLRSIRSFDDMIQFGFDAKGDSNEAVLNNKLLTVSFSITPRNLRV